MSSGESCRYRILHHTAYRYSEPVMLSHQQLHLTPRPLSYQQLHQHRMTIEPEPTVRRDLVDAFGNAITEITLESAHRGLDISALAELSVAARPLPQPDETPPWDSVRDALSYRAAWRPEREILEATRFLFESPNTRVKRDLRAYAGDCLAPGRPILSAAATLMKKIHAEFRFHAGTTTVTTPVMTFFAQKRGVCQDFAHLMISCLRSSGLAARYVSGYLLTHPAPGRPRRVGADASHAWVSLFVPGHGWVDLDPTNNVLPAVEHITIAWGRDFSDVTPLRGVINGGGIQSLEVKGTVEPVGDPIGAAAAP